MLKSCVFLVQIYGMGQLAARLVLLLSINSLSIYLLWEDISGDPLESLTRANKFKIELAVKSYDCIYKYNHNPHSAPDKG